MLHGPRETIPWYSSSFINTPVKTDLLVLLKYYFGFLLTQLQIKFAWALCFCLTVGECSTWKNNNDVECSIFLKLTTKPLIISDF